MCADNCGFIPRIAGSLFFSLAPGKDSQEANGLKMLQLVFNELCLSLAWDRLLIKDDKTKHCTNPKVTSELMAGDLLLCFRGREAKNVNTSTIINSQK